MQAIETIGQSNNYRRRRLRDQNDINFKSEYDRITGELSQSNILEQITATQARHKVLKKALIAFLLSIYYKCRRFLEPTILG